nr:peptidoglycan DD-metalloendopeptidase family protein [Leifsonia soli]
MRRRGGARRGGARRGGARRGGARRGGARRGGATRRRRLAGRWCLVSWALVVCVLVARPGAAGAVSDPGTEGRWGAAASEDGRDRVSTSRVDPSEPEGRWSWPVVSPTVAAPYAAPPTRYAAGHRGIDLTAAAGTPVAAPDGAVVRFAGTVVDRPVLTLDHGGGVLSSFEPLSSDLPVGSAVARGEVIGLVGSGGHCGGGCLHVGVRMHGEYVSPMLFFARVPPAVLLPLGSG